MKVYTVCQIILCVTGCLVNALTSEEITEVTETCCVHAESSAVTSPSVEACSATPPEDIEPEQMDTCVAALKSCCIQQFKEKNACSAGMKLAPKKRCTDPETDIGKTCCEECSFGRWTGESQGKDACGSPSGDDVSPSTALRKNAFHHCCLNAAGKSETTTETNTEKIETKVKDKCKNDSCEHICDDGQGTVICQCREGFRLQADKKSCKDINECAEALDDLCTADGTVCHNTPGGFKCVPIKKRDVGLTCPPGFKRNVINQVCDDINECLLPRPPCPRYICENIIGGYKCAGKRGKPFEELVPGAATEPTSASTEATKNDICPPGFRAGPDDECLDIDECEERLDDCQRLSQHCINTHGNFFCQDHVSKRCAPGLMVNAATGVCEDIDECQESTEVCKRNEVCVNLPGAYNCKSKISTLPKLATKTCQEGTRLRPGGKICEDVDECREGTHLCDQFQNCINTFGAHECRCKNGFELDSSSGSCIDIDECALKLDNCSPGMHCLNVLGSFTCTRKIITTTSTAAPPLYEYEYYYSDEDNSTDGESETVPTLTSTSTTLKPRTVYKPTPITNITRSRPSHPPNRSRNNSNTSTPKPTTTPTRPQYTPRRPEDLPRRPEYTPRPQNTPRRPEDTPTRPEESLGRPDNTPRRPENTPRRPENTPGRPQDNPRIPEDTNERPEYTLRRPEESPRRSENTPTGPEDNPRRPVNTPRRPEDSPRTSVESPRRPEYTPRRPEETPRYPESTPRRPEPTPRRPDPTPRTPAPTPSIPVEVATPTPVNKNIEDSVGFDPNEVHCLNGYEKNALGICVDINECENGWHICSSLEVCANREGGYTCECMLGFQRGSDGWCVVIPTTSTTSTTSTTTSTTTTTTTETPTAETSPEWPYTRPRGNRIYPPMSCDFGYKFDSSIGKCVDIDECASNKATCSVLEDCVNNEGGYECVCGSRCQADNENPTDGIPVLPASPAPRPSSGLGGSNVITVGAQYGQRGPWTLRPTYTRLPNSGAVVTSCPWGYKLTPDKRCFDIDECERNVSECGTQQRCENFHGGYACQCPAGHKLVGQNGCEDIDECMHGNPCSYNSQCVNTVGSYRCLCGEGFRNAPTNDKVCVDVDECSETPGVCHQGCANAWGGYRCFCKRGYRLDKDNRTCVDVNECEEWSGVRLRGKLCGGDCVNEPGSYRCACPAGYRLSEDSRSCIDIDECETGEATCAHTSDPGYVCQNTRGSYHCHHIDCPDGYRLESKHRCNRIQRSCPIADWSCLQLPSTYSYNFITFVANIYLPAGSVDLFTMHGPTWSESLVSFEMRMIKVQASPGVEPADLRCFDMRPSGNICVISLLCPLGGPQVAELELTMSLYQRGQFAGSAVARLVVIVSQYEF